jgi:hypothetical protein
MAREKFGNHFVSMELIEFGINIVLFLYHPLICIHTCTHTYTH